MKRIDIIVSLVIGEAAALLMLVIGRNLGLPSGLARLLLWLPLVFPLFTLAVVAVGSVLGRYRLGFYQLAKFALVGGLNFLIDLGVLNLLIAATAVTAGFYANAFKAAAFLAAMTSSFLWNKFWTFRSLSSEHAVRQFAGFFVVSLVGLGINVAVFAVLNDAVGPRGGIDARTWANISAAGAAVVGLLWNFLGYKFLVFRRSK